MKTKAIRLTQAMQKKTDKTARFMLVGTILCCIAPFLFYFAMQTQASMLKISLMELIESNALINLNMIVAFATPLCGYILYLCRKRVIEHKDFNVVYLNLTLLLITQILSMNILYLCMFAYLLYKTFGIYEKPYKEAFNSLNVKFVFQELGGAILLLLIFGLVCVLTLRLNFVV